MLLVRRRLLWRRCLPPWFWTQSTGTPQQWGGGFHGYGLRVLSRVASGDVVQNGIQFPRGRSAEGGCSLHWQRSAQDLRRRAVHTIVYSFLTYNNQGHPTLNIANIGGYYGATAISTRWLPGTKDALLYAQ